MPLIVLRPRNTVFLAKVEATSGVDAVPTASADAVLINGEPRISFNVNMIQTEEVTGSLDGAGSIQAGMNCEISFDVYVKGSGAAGTVPEWGKLLRACGYAETILAAPVPASAEACAAGGSTTLANLGTSAAAVLQQYRGMPVQFTGTVAGLSFVADYTAAKAATLTDTMSGSIAATTSYQVLANVLYAPASNSIPSLTFYVYSDGILYKFFGCRGDVKNSTQTNNLGVFSFTFKGVFGGKVDAAVPTPTYDATRPPAFLNAKMTMNRLAAAVSQFSLENGAELAFPDDPNEVEGVSPPVHTSRRMTGSLNPLETLVATRDLMGDFRAGTKRIIHLRYGTVAGNRVAITIPQALYTNQTPSDRNRMMQVDVPFECIGKDSGAFICLY